MPRSLKLGQKWRPTSGFPLQGIRDASQAPQRTIGGLVDVAEKAILSYSSFVMPRSPTYFWMSFVYSVAAADIVKRALKNDTDPEGVIFSRTADSDLESNYLTNHKSPVLYRCTRHKRTLDSFTVLAWEQDLEEAPNRLKERYDWIFDGQSAVRGTLTSRFGYNGYD